MRLFTGIDLPDEIRGRLRLLIERLKPAARVNWSSVENLHVTTKFIGEWPDPRVEELTQALGEMAPAPGIRIAVEGLGWFPNPRSPRVFWAGIKADPALAELARSTDRTCARLGAPVETRPYSPHLTLARIKEPAPLDRLREAIAALGETSFGEFRADRFHLYQSRLTGSGSVYTRLASFPLGVS
ncbi:MAG: RNA 2',3'-cyclic phosphodiesterase [Bryobacterales bacterium]|jgi:2'-5' RNA ligase|nr:RNA 2',3'-cyclic phosphodiesterase [Bryobacterales bacterium]